jgi:hypothetical protein
VPRIEEGPALKQGSSDSPTTTHQQRLESGLLTSSLQPQCSTGVPISDKTEKQCRAEAVVHDSRQARRESALRSVEQQSRSPHGWQLHEAPNDQKENCRGPNRSEAEGMPQPDERVSGKGRRAPVMSYLPLVGRSPEGFPLKDFGP